MSLEPRSGAAPWYYFAGSWAGFSSPAAMVSAGLLLWLAMLVWGANLPGAGVAIMAVQALAVGWLMVSLAMEADRRLVSLLFCAALLLYTAEVLWVQTTEQWTHGVFDTPRYDLNARALAMHWTGQAVPAAAFRLDALAAAGVAEWRPDDTRPYVAVFGFSRYFYQLYVAAIYVLTQGSQATAVFSNLSWAAALPIGAFLLANGLFESRRVAGLAAGLALLDPMPAVWSAILMRDVMIAFLSTLTLAGSVHLLRCRRGRWENGLAIVLAGSLLALTRFNSVAALALGWFSVALPARRARHVMLVVTGMGVALFALVQTVPELESRWENSLPGQVLQEGLAIYQKSRVVDAIASGAVGTGPHGRIDAVRQEWYTNLREQPLWINLARAVARSLMAPFPWVALTHGLTGTNYYELLFPGMALWILFLPAFFYALWHAPVRRDPAVRFCLVWLGTVMVVYIIGYGQLDGRNRLMAQPLLWVFAARGTVLLSRRFNGFLSKEVRSE